MTKEEFRKKLFDLWKILEDNTDNPLEGVDERAVANLGAAGKDLLFALGMRWDDHNHNFTFAPSVPAQLTWKDVFSLKKHYGHISYAAKAALVAGYELMVFNDKVYVVWDDGMSPCYLDTGRTEKEVR